MNPLMAGYSSTDDSAFSPRNPLLMGQQGGYYDDAAQGLPVIALKVLQGDTSSQQTAAQAPAATTTSAPTLPQQGAASGTQPGQGLGGSWAPPGAPGGLRWGPALPGVHVVGSALGALFGAPLGLLRNLMGGGQMGADAHTQQVQNQITAAATAGHPHQIAGWPAGSMVDEFGNIIQNGHIFWPAGFGPFKGMSAGGFTDDNGDYHTNLHWDENAGTYVVGAPRVYTSNARMTPDGKVVYVDAYGKPGAAPQDSPDVIARRSALKAQERYPPSWPDGVGVGTRFIPQTNPPSPGF